MAKTLFEHIENFFTKGEPFTVETDFKEAFMSIKFLSLHPASFSAAEEANRLATKIPQWAVGCYLFNTVPKGRTPHLTIPKNEKESRWPKELIEAVCNFFYCSPHHAIQTIEILNQIDPKLITRFGVEVKQSGNGNRKVSKQKRS